MDANDDISQPKHHQGIGHIMSEMDLVDLHHFKFPSHPRPATYTRGSLTIDLCLGSPEFTQAMITTSILPFGLPIHIHGNHCTLLLDFDSRILFRNAPPPQQNITNRGTKSNDIPTVTRFCKIAGEGCDSANIAGRLAQIEDRDQLTAEDRQELNCIDKEITDILLWPDKQCKKFPEYPWSPTLHQVYLVHWFWTVKLSKVCTKCKFPSVLLRISQRVIDKTQLQQLVRKSINSCQCSARTQLWQVR